MAVIRYLFSPDSSVEILYVPDTTPRQFPLNAYMFIKTDSSEYWIKVTKKGFTRDIQTKFVEVLEDNVPAHFRVHLLLIK